MKPKEINRKLFLSKRTIAHLSNREMTAAYGGVTTIPKKCDPVHEATRSCPTNNSDGLACCCGGDTTIEIC